MTRSGGMRGLITWVSVVGFIGTTMAMKAKPWRRSFDGFSENPENSQGAAGNCLHAPAQRRRGHENA